MSILINRGICQICFRSPNRHVARVTHLSARLASTSEEHASDNANEESDPVEQKRNVSNMSDWNRGKMAHVFKQPSMEFVNEKGPWFVRRMYALHGSASGIDPSVMWPSRKQLRETKAHEQEFEPPLMDRIKLVETKEAEDAEWRRQRIEEVDRNMQKMPQWLAEHHQREKKKTLEIERQQKKKEQLLDEAREYFGYAVDPRDAKYQKMIEDKELEEKKTAKLRKKQMKEDKILQRVQAMADAAKSSGDSASVDSSSPTDTTAADVDSSDKSTNTTENVVKDR